jgi:isoleucyl-tRNA synthetase
LAREIISRVQRMRKDAGLAVSDRIRLIVGGDNEIAAVVSNHRDWIASEVLATELLYSPDKLPANAGTQTFDLDGVDVWVSLTRIE